MDPFALRRLGRSDVMLPQLGFGGAPLGNLYDAIEEADAEATLQAAWDAGIRFYDTAPFYGRGLSEHRLGHVLRRKPPGEVLLSTKVGRILHAPRDPQAFAARERNWPNGLHFEYRHDYTYDGIMRSYEDSLQRLGMNRVDLLVIHDLDLDGLGSEARVGAHLAMLGTSGINALADLKSEGLIGAIGVGVNRLGTIPVMLDMIDGIDFFLVAAPYTLADQDVLDREFPLCAARGIGFVIGQVFASGILATGPVPGARYRYAPADEATMARIGQMQTICERHGVSLASAALQFPLHHPLVASVIPGAFAPAQVTRNVETMRAGIPPEMWHALKREGLLREDAPTP